MFAKSKRFQEGAKDYIPGPGEYNIPTSDELSRHKRYGFLNQTTRFDGEGPVEISPDFFTGDNSTSVTSLSSDTRFSVSTNNSSSNKTTDDMRTKRHMSELATQFEKYRHTMQKEIESLQLKNRKMETTIQSMTLEKETTKSTLLKNNQELASLRQENMLLQKSMGRLEKNIDKSPKVIRLQKRLDQLENELNDTKDTLIKAQQVAEEDKRVLLFAATEKDETITQLTTQIEEQSQMIRDLNENLIRQQQHLDHVKEKDQQVINELQSKLDETKTKLFAAHETLDQKEHQATALKIEMDQQQQQFNDVCTAKTQLQTEMNDIKEYHEQEREEWNTTQHNLQQEIEQLNQQLKQSHQELTELGEQVTKGQQEILSLCAKMQDQHHQLQSKEGLIEKLHVRFDTYHQHVTQVMHEMKERMKSKDPSIQYERLANELVEAKKFINKQAMNLDALKSDLHWMAKWNRQLNELIETIHQDDISHGFITVPTIMTTNKNKNTISTQRRPLSTSPLLSSSSSSLLLKKSTISSLSLSSSSISSTNSSLKNRRKTNSHYRGEKCVNKVKDTVPKNDSGFSTNYSEGTAIM
ncbi:hypothetical protein BDC45DRAFT_552396 [Circinella umbellata]|nr:hypothetical protein BDC45DRAFT_552396 [Circinella umbellata]